MNELTTKIASEAARIEEDTEHSMKGHYNAADRWARYHLWLGLSAATFAAIASTAAFNLYPEVAGILASISTALTTVLTFLKPSERAENHKAIAGQYLALRNRTRIFREIELDNEIDISAAKKFLIELSSGRDDLNHRAPSIPRQDYERARSDIEAGRSQYSIDQGTR
jgi:hypothetical protein